MPEPRLARAPRLADVARLAGVSPATASRALHGGDRDVREDNRLRVIEAARSLGYAANLAAQAVARGRNRGVALIVREVPDDYANPIVAGVLAAARRRQMPVSIAAAGQDFKDLVECAQNARSLRPEILIVAGGRGENDPATTELVDSLQRFEQEGGRVVMISQPGLPFDTVSYDNVGGGRDMAKTLLELGYRDYAIISGHLQGLTQRDRTNGFIEGLSNGGVHLPADRILTGAGDFSRDNAYALTGELLRRGTRPDAIFAVSDAMALGVLTFLRDATGPTARIGVAGFDDIKALRDITPSLTTVHLPWEDVAEKALTMALLPQLKEPRQAVISGHVVVRESTPHAR